MQAYINFIANLQWSQDCKALPFIQICVYDVTRTEGRVKRDNHLLLLFLVRKRRLKDQIKTASRGILGRIKSEIQYYFIISQQMEGMKDGWMANLLSTISLPGEFSPLKAMVQIHQHQDEFFWILTSVLWVKRCDEKEPKEDLKTTASTNVKVPVGTTAHMNN